MNNKKWWQSEVIYQIYPRSFQDSNHDGIGDIRGIISRLDYLVDLGITSIWISPIYQSPMADNGYDISDYFAIAPEFGTIDDFKDLLYEAKKRQIKIILDLVVNHTSDEHAWFQEALRDKNSKYRNYYIFKNSPHPPTNWRSIFGGSVWEKLPNEDVYYYHTFHKKQPDLNWENPELRNEIYSMVNWWLDLGVSGFRIDAITFIKKNLDFNFIESDGVDGLAKCTKVSRNQPGIEIFLRELRDKCFRPNQAITIAEAPGVEYNQLDDFIGKDGFFSMIFDFKIVDLDIASGSEWFKSIDWTPRDLFNRIKNSQLAIQKVGWGAPFIENHDQNRAPSKYLGSQEKNSTAQKALALLYFYLYGTPFIYQGQEIGMINFQRNSVEEFDDISSIDQYYRAIAEGLTASEALKIINYRSRDNARTPMQWDDSEYVGFSDAKPWLNITEQSQIRNVSSQIKDKSSLWHFYQQLIQIKKNPLHETLTFGKISFPRMISDEVFAYRRYDEKHSYIVVVNLSDRTFTLDILLSEVNILLDNGQISEINKKLQLQPYGAVLAKEIFNDK